jgi:hypothetical protein
MRITHIKSLFAHAIIEDFFGGFAYFRSSQWNAPPVALWHHFFLRDGLLARMRPKTRS